ncbi:tRNA (adenine(22)-N(1))-methyltransferase [Lacicoccus alkaliphilus]|uniref:tRNA (Adenine22-N1)-methyltransferase n=1 Tax=Lacicoccus alkaliphilus DSM 16010 TaxID=1123231 RepID=A0A1M7BKF1_9BACL|nr:tRNA (adenine(22)-N(1))-methyltransferase TrmK [Salinicoccus alkaliphilus]SHL55460.1 tRNA (adenine22-N1)-methyltransferase [Salinicoccus alkaliphilus DSM 16010]
MIDERLKYAADHIKGDNLADIGSDHAYLPIYAVREGLIKSAICGEVVPGPYEATVKNISTYGYGDRIEARLGDGLKILTPDDELDTITICGMGGPLIASILRDGFDNVRDFPRLVLQANNYTHPLRKAVSELNYSIVHEKVLKLGKHYYEIIVCDHGESREMLTEKELHFGPVNLERREEAFLMKVRWEYEHQKRIFDNIDGDKNTDKRNEIKSKIKLLEEVLEDED